MVIISCISVDVDHMVLLLSHMSIQTKSLLKTGQGLRIAFTPMCVCVCVCVNSKRKQNLYV